MARRPAVPGVDRRQQILEAALDVFAEWGFEGATTKEIATRADVTHGLIYFYFPSKEELFAAVCAHQAEVVSEQLSRVIERDPDETPDHLLRCVISHFVEAIAAPRTISLLRIMMRTNVHGKPCGMAGEAGRTRMRAFGLHIAHALSQYLEAQMEQGTLRAVDTNVTAHFMASGIVHLVICRALSDESLEHYSLRQLADSISDVFLHGLLAQPAPLRRVLPASQALS
jgi:AcrR family transcriptional regulator